MPSTLPASPHMAGNRSFFYDFDDYSPSESDTTSTSSSSNTSEDHLSQQESLDHRAGESLEKTGARDEGRQHAYKKDVSDRQYSRFSVSNQYFKSKGKVSKLDGRLKISVNETDNSGWLAKTLGPGIRHHLGFSKEEGKQNNKEAVQIPVTKQERQDTYGAARHESHVQRRGAADDGPKRVPKFNIVIIVIGSRGDIQPFLKIGKILKYEHGHRVRIATHPAFKDFVERDSGLEFFSVGGDPSELMAFMVKNPGLIPSVETVRAGEIGRRRKSMYEMFNGMWRACINTTDDENDKENVQMMGDKHPFVADAIIANPPSFAHVHIAERLGVPLHMMFTFPYSPTMQFPHPLANIKQSNIDESYTNFMSYPLVEMMTWQGLGDLVNKFRAETLRLEPVSTLWAPGQLHRLTVPYTYLWSPTIVPKPADWGPEIDIAGFTFLDLASSFEPPEALVQFLNAGPPPIYIGFGSIVVDDPDAFTDTIFRAVSLAGVRALVSKGWGGIGGSSGGGGDASSPGNGDRSPSPSRNDDIFLLDNTPHDWLFPRVAAVVHHGGAGTTAIGLKCGRPTMIVPFFGDQPFWGAMVAKLAGAGAHACVPYRKLTAEILAEGIRQCLEDGAKRNAARLAESIAAEGDGAENAVKSFHAKLPLREHEGTGSKGEAEDVQPSMRCSLLREKVAVWQLKEKKSGKRKKSGGGNGDVIRLSALAAEILAERGRLGRADLRLARVYDWNDFEGPGEPVSGVGSAVAGTVVETAHGVGSVPAKAMKTVHKHGRHEKRKWKLARRRKEQEAHDRAAQEPPYQEPASSDDTAVVVDNGTTSNSNHTGDKQHPRRPDLSAHHPSSTSPTDPLPAELCRTAGHGLHQSASALARAPVDLALALAQGFHNAPRLYGDDTVRRPVRITGWRSGVRASRRELTYGVYDGFAGLWKQPAKGWREGGAAGAAKGVALGVGGVVLKNVSAVVGPVAFCAKGLHKEVRKWRWKDEEWVAFVRRARMLQGKREGGELESEDARRVVEERVLRAWDSRVEEAGVMGECSGRRDEKDGSDEKTRTRGSEKPVPRRRSTLKKRQWPQHKITQQEMKMQAGLLGQEGKESVSVSDFMHEHEDKGNHSMGDGFTTPAEDALANGFDESKWTNNTVAAV